MNFRNKNHPQTRGIVFTEIALYALLLACVSGPIVLSLVTTLKSAAHTNVRMNVGQASRTALLRIEEDLRRALKSTVAVGTGSSKITFNVEGGFNGAAVIPGDSIEYQVQLAEGEELNSVDDNKNGLVDEARLIRRNLTKGQQMVVAENLGYTQSYFSFDGKAVTVRIASLGALRSEQYTYQIATDLTIYPRN